MVNIVSMPSLRYDVKYCTEKTEMWGMKAGHREGVTERQGVTDSEPDERACWEFIK